MNQEMQDAMKLEGADQFFQDNPEAPITVPDQYGEMIEMDPMALAAEGMAFAQSHMARNGPTRPNHIGRAKTMTKRQLKEQQMNEQEGYPSNLDEADKTKELEGRVAGIETGINQILSHLSGQSSPAIEPQSGSTGGNPVSPVGNPTPTPAPSETVSPLSPPLTGSSGSSEPDNRQPKLRQVTLRDGRKVSVPQNSSPAMNLGPATETTQPPSQVEEEALQVGDDWDDPIAVVPEPEQDGPSSDPERDAKAIQVVKVQILVEQVNQFMQANDVHRFWRRHLGQKVHRHIGYSGWPTKLQKEFDGRFETFLKDPQFVSSVCKKVVSMEMGHALGAKIVTSFLVSTAGFVAFAMSGLDD